MTFHVTHLTCISLFDMSKCSMFMSKCFFKSKIIFKDQNQLSHHLLFNFLAFLTFVQALLHPDPHRQQPSPASMLLPCQHSAHTTDAVLYPWPALSQMGMAWVCFVLLLLVSVRWWCCWCCCCEPFGGRWPRRSGQKWWCGQSWRIHTKNLAQVGTNQWKLK